MSLDVIIPKLNVLFNKIMEVGKFPNQWCLALITPIHKKGSVNGPANYPPKCHGNKFYKNNK